MDVLHPLLKFADHYRYTLAAVVLVAVCVGWLGACASTTPGLDDPSRPVSRPALTRQAVEAERAIATEKAELEAKVAALNAKIEAHNAALDAAVADLDRQDAMRAKILQTVGGAALQLAGGTVDPVGLIVTGVGLAGTALTPALIADSRRKDKRIKALGGEK